MPTASSERTRLIRHDGRDAPPTHRGAPSSSNAQLRTNWSPALRREAVPLAHVRPTQGWTRCRSSESRSSREEIVVFARCGTTGRHTGSTNKSGNQLGHRARFPHRRRSSAEPGGAPWGGYELFDAAYLPTRRASRSANEKPAQVGFPATAGSRSSTRRMPIATRAFRTPDLLRATLEPRPPGSRLSSASASTRLLGQ